MYPAKYPITSSWAVTALSASYANVRYITHTLTDAATINTDISLGNHFKVTLGGNRTLGNPTNMVDGDRIIWEIRQDGVGNRTITLGSDFRLSKDLPEITLTTESNARDYLTAIYDSSRSSWDVTSFIRGFNASGSKEAYTASYSLVSLSSSYSTITPPRVVTITDQAILQTNTNLGDHFRVTLGGNRTLANPTSSYDGLRVSWELIQDGSGGHTISLGNKFVTGSDFNVQLNQTASKRDFMTAMYNNATDKWYVLGFVRGY